MSEMRARVALVIGRAIWGGEVVPDGKWLEAADAAIAEMSRETKSPQLITVRDGESLNYESAGFWESLVGGIFI